MKPLAVTENLLGAFQLDEHGDAIHALFSGLEPQVTEWSMNAAHDPRGQLRVGCGSRDRERVANTLEKLGHGYGRRLIQAFSDHSEENGVGMALRPGRVTSRWWAMSRRYHGHLLAGTAMRVMPELDPWVRLLADVCGGMGQCRAVGVEGFADEVWRQTIYFSLSTPETAIALLEHIGAHVTWRGKLFFQALAGLDAKSGRPWPVMWAARSVGQHGGWKFYYFARRDPYRRNDSVLLDLVEASPELWNAWHIVRGRALPDERTSGVVQFIGLTMADGAPSGTEPAWTVYLG